MSDRSRSFLLTWTCWRIWSMPKFFSSGCENCALTLDATWGLKLLKKLVDVNRELFQFTLYEAPVGSVWLTPRPPAKLLLSMLVAPPENALVEACACDCRERVEVSVGAQNDLACETPTSEICGSIRWIWMPRVCSSASFTASSIDSGRVVSCVWAAWLAAAWMTPSSFRLMGDCPLWPKADTDMAIIATAMVAAVTTWARRSGKHRRIA